MRRVLHAFACALLLGLSDAQSAESGCACINPWETPAARAVNRTGLRPGETASCALRDATGTCYPLTHGALECRAWDQSAAECSDAATAPSWCALRWCWVDPSQCLVEHRPSARFDSSASSVRLSFSYAACGNVDAAPVDEGHSWGSPVAAAQTRVARHLEVVFQRVLQIGRQLTHDGKPAPEGLGNPDHWGATKLPLHIIAFIGLLVSVVSGFIILYKANAMGWEKLRRSPSKRLPMYIALGDIIFSATHWFDHLWVVMKGHVAPFPSCSVFAWFTYMGIMMSVFGALFLALFAFYRLMIDPLSEPNLGKLDWIPFLVFYGIPLLLTGLAYNDNALGPGTSWCILGGGLIKTWAALGWFIMPICVVMGINMLAYGAIGYKLADVVANIGDNPTSRNLVKFMTEMKAYVGIYVFAFIPIAVTTILGVYYAPLGKTTTYQLVLDYIVVCTVNLNGTLNMLAFVYFSSVNGKKKLEERASRLSVIALEEGSAWQRDPSRLDSKSRSKRNRGSVDTRWSSRWLPAPRPPASPAESSVPPPPSKDNVGSVTV